MSSVFLYVAIVGIWAFVLVPRRLRRHHAQPMADLDDDAYPDPAPEEQHADYGIVPPVGGGHIAPDSRRRPAPLPRARMLQARRRLLSTLLVLTAATAACVALRIVPWWACVPPAGVLCVYVLLLREAAQADAEQARRRAAAATREARLRAAARRRAQEAAATARAQPSAQVIDISARVGDQLYDQYTDGTVRAVGD